MKIDVEKKSHNIVLIRPHGKIVSGEKVMALKQSINKVVEEGFSKVIVDFENVPFMDSTGLGILIAAYTTLKAKEGQMSLIKITQRIKDLLTITKLLTLFDCYDSEADALRDMIN
ncbi:MAG TPA: anti-sigma factor antagonist [Firmicutes bacterium]|nr:anti-sigma factor antagonist [Bacillota bacterium]